MKDTPDHVNWHRPMHREDWPRRYRRLHDIETEALIRVRELESENPWAGFGFWHPWQWQPDRDHGDYFSWWEILHRISWELVFESGAPVASAAPPETWERIKESLPDTEVVASTLTQGGRQPVDSVALATQLKERLEFFRDKPEADCCDLVRGEMKRVNTGQLGDLIAFHKQNFPDEREWNAAITMIAVLRPFWVRDLAAWRMPNPAGPHAFDSLLYHLFVEFPPPPFLAAAWRNMDWCEMLPFKWIAWFILLGRGASLRRAGEVFGWRVPEDLPARLAEAPPDFMPFEACAWAEVHRLGGSEVEFRRIRALPAFAIDLTQPFGEWAEVDLCIPDWFHEGREYTERFLGFWRETIPWLVHWREAMNDAQSLVILEWATGFVRLPPEGALFSWRGRTPRACLRRIAEEEEMHNPYLRTRWKTKGWNWDWEQDAEVSWSVRELCSGRELYEEGARMGHCVGLYGDRCLSGDSAIFSLRRGDAPCLTIEVNPKQRRVVQMLGAQNRLPTEEERAAAKFWSDEVLRGGEIGSAG